MFPSTLDRFKDKIAPIVLNEEEKLRLNYVIMNQSMYDAGLPFIPDNQDSDSGVLNCINILNLHVCLSLRQHTASVTLFLFIMFIVLGASSDTGEAVIPSMNLLTQ